MTDQPDSAPAPPPAAAPLPETVTATLNAQLAAVDSRMAEIATARAALNEQADALRHEHDQLRLARAGLSTALRIPRTPKKRAAKTAVTPPAEKPAKRVKEGEGAKA